MNVARHAVFDRTPGFRGDRPAGFKMDYVGALFPAAWDGGDDTAAYGEADVTIPLPPADEEIFEWIDLLESVERASRQYVMIELGAGYGRWGVRAGLAARRAGIPDIRLVFCEGLPKHSAWLRKSLQINGLSDCATIYDAAIAYDGAPIPFLSESARDGAGWFGQARSFPGAPERGYKEIMVNPITLEEITDNLGVIDLIDMDLQLAEREVVAMSMDTLKAKVKRVHIGTHSHEVEDEIRAAFTAAGWIRVFDFRCGEENATPFGPVRFVDGVQSWVNPRLI